MLASTIYNKAPASVHAACELNKMDYRSASADLLFKIYKNTNEPLTHQEATDATIQIKSALEENLPADIVEALTIELNEPITLNSPTRTFNVYLYAPEVHPIDIEDYLNSIITQISNLNTPDDITVFQQTKSSENLIVIKFRPSIELPIRAIKSHATRYLEKFGNIIHTDESELQKNNNKLSLQLGSRYEGPSIYHILDLKTNFLPKTKISLKINEIKKGQLYFNILSPYRYCQYCRSNTHRIHQCPVYNKCQACSSEQHCYIQCDKVEEEKRSKKFETLSQSSQKIYFSNHSKNLPQWMEKYQKETDKLAPISDDIDLLTEYPSPEPSDIDQDNNSETKTVDDQQHDTMNDDPINPPPQTSKPPFFKQIKNTLDEIETSFHDKDTTKGGPNDEEMSSSTIIEDYSKEAPSPTSIRFHKTPKKTISTNRKLRSESLKTRNLMEALETAHNNSKKSRPVKEALSHLQKKAQGDMLSTDQLENTNNSQDTMESNQLSTDGITKPSSFSQ
ncbi:hypothetical protein DAMA08_002810 [Martiniozyma asiatica (nom. inval.)]|nr:hypothetical protein DAMA08_002810 [Martiniozyma asiatica]